MPGEQGRHPVRLATNLDPTTHPITGYARAAMEAGGTTDAAYFSCPAISEISTNLWSGGCLDGVELPGDFDYVVSLYPWGKWAIGEKTQRIEWKMYDSVDEALDAVDERAETVNTLRAMGKTLVHCQAGLNRSGIITARALMLGPEKLTAREAIDLLREKRSELVLCNKQFEEWLLGLD